MKIFSNGGKIGFAGQNNMVLKDFDVVDWNIETERPLQSVMYGGFKHAEFAVARTTVKVTLTLEAPAENMKVYTANDIISIRKAVFGVPDHIPDEQVERYANRIAR
jgi:hypothetical protein